MEKHRCNNTSKWEKLEQYIQEKYIPRETFAPTDLTIPSTNPNVVGKLKKMPRGSIYPMEMEHQKRPLPTVHKTYKGDSNQSYSRETFYEMLVRIMKENNLNFDDLFTSTVDKEEILKLKEDIDYRPSKQTIMFLCFKLKLNIDIALDFLSKLGYGLSYQKKQDVILRYFLENEEYDIEKVNQALLDYGYSILFK